MPEHSRRPRRLTPKQFSVLKFIRNSIEEKGAPPTRAEIAQAFGFSSLNAAESHLRALARKGLISLSARHSRGIRLEEPALRFQASRESLPLDIAPSGGSDFRDQAWVQISPALFSPPADGLYSAADDAMLDSGIRAGDWVAVHKTDDWPAPGKIAFIRFEGKTAFRKISQEGALMRFTPDDKRYEAYCCPKSERRHLIGVAVGLVRRL